MIGLNKLMKHYIPDADDTKGSLEIVLEVIGQMILLFIGLFYIHRLVTFVPTYSKQEYVTFNVHTIILGTILIVSSLHTRLGEKTSILAERVSDLWNGESRLNGKNEFKNILCGNVTASIVNTETYRTFNIFGTVGSDGAFVSHILLINPTSI